MAAANLFILDQRGVIRRNERREIPAVLNLMKGMLMVKVYSIGGVTPVVHPTAFIHPTASLIGDVVIGPDCYVGPGASIRADFGRFEMGRGSNFQDNCTAHGFVGEEIIVGEDCNIGHGAVIHGAVIHDRVLVGMNAVVMDGVVLHDDVLVAALAFIPAAMKVPAGVIAAGTPAKIMRELTEEEKKWKVAGNHDYHKLTERCRHSLMETEALTQLDGPLPRLKLEGSEPLYKTRQKT
ncbi:MAG: Carnitine operon protein CaiE [Alphaproteobacteria bacterium MarineAlpha11_Bin1]|nr:MAG: Carnitine operon protein CaiE [Alphaproteobacteria bacterium MarineAlpha11_Bin1]